MKLIPDFNEDENNIYKILSHDPIHIDQLSKAIGINGQIILSTLLQLELKGLKEQLPGKMIAIN